MSKAAEDGHKIHQIKGENALNTSMQTNDTEAAPFANLFQSVSTVSSQISQPGLYIDPDTRSSRPSRLSQASTLSKTSKASKASKASKTSKASEGSEIIQANVKHGKSHKTSVDLYDFVSVNSEDLALLDEQEFNNEMLAVNEPNIPILNDDYMKSINFGKLLITTIIVSISGFIYGYCQSIPSNLLCFGIQGANKTFGVFCSMSRFETYIRYY